jgi:hypothetical protein
MVLLELVVMVVLALHQAFLAHQQHTLVVAVVLPMVQLVVVLLVLVALVVAVLVLPVVLLHLVQPI